MVPTGSVGCPGHSQGLTCTHYLIPRALPGQHLILCMWDTYPPHPTWHTGIVTLPTKRAEEGSWASPAPTSLGAGGIGALSGALGGQDLCHGNYPLTKQATEKAHGHFSPLCLHSCSSGVGRQATSCKMEFNHKNLFMHLS